MLDLDRIEKTNNSVLITDSIIYYKSLVNSDFS